MNPSDYEIVVDDEGKEYVHRTSSEVTKFHQGIEDEDYEPEGGRLYATRTPLCPVASFRKYLSKRNKQNTYIMAETKRFFR